MLWLLPARHMCSRFKWGKRRSVGIWIRFFPLFLCCVYMFWEDSALPAWTRNTMMQHTTSGPQTQKLLWSILKSRPNSCHSHLFFPQTFPNLQKLIIEVSAAHGRVFKNDFFAKSTWGKGKTAISGCTNSWCGIPISDPTIFHTFGLREIGEAVLQRWFLETFESSSTYCLHPPDRSWVIESWVAPSSICVQVSSNLSEMGKWEQIAFVEAVHFVSTKTHLASDKPSSLFWTASLWSRSLHWNNCSCEPTIHPNLDQNNPNVSF